ncbi:hypothetical protein A2U01_0080099, partial [Trifolium medium]|nr:hypothetical protein [Trifolium medium]
MSGSCNLFCAGLARRCEDVRCLDPFRFWLSVIPWGALLS